jgi:hypothetical protein
LLDVTDLLLFGIVFVAALLQTTSGFGFALMAMPLVALVIGVKAAAPLVALVGLTLYAVNLVRYRRGFDRRVALPLAVAMALGVPLGVWSLGNLDEQIVKSVLAVVLIAYALYGVWKPRTAPLRSSLWAYPAGFLAGVLGGAFNTPGPPASLPGEFPHRVSGDLQRSIQMRLDRRSLSVRVIATAPHADVLEARRPFLRRTMRELRPTLRAILLEGRGSGRFKFSD